MKNIINISLSTDPEIETRSVLPFKKVEDRNEKQFETTKDSKLEIRFINEEGLDLVLTLFAEAGTKFDGATIPLGIGKGDMRLQIPSLFHDIMCNNKHLVDYDRAFSSLIFKKLLISCGVGRFMAQVMFLAVDNYQKYFCDWKRKDE